MLGIYYLIGALAAAAVITAGLLLHFKAPTKINIFFKTVSLILATALFFRYMTAQDNIVNVENLQLGNGFNSKGIIVVALLQVWFAYAVEMLVILAPFFKVRTVPAAVSYLATSIFAFNFIMMGSHLLAITGAEAFERFNVRAMLVAVETGLGIGYCVVHTVHNIKDIRLRGNEWVWFAFACVGIILAAFPCYAPNVVLNKLQITYNPDDLNLYHRLYIYPAAIIPIVLYVILKDKPMDTKRFVVMLYAWLALLNYSYNHRIPNFTEANFGWVTNLPLHLCNTALYITPICLTFKFKRFFYFTYFINVLGAFLALMMPNYSDTASIISPSVVLFFMYHYQAFFMPLLVVGLGIFRRPRWKEFGYSMIGFAAYFLLVLVTNAWFSNYNPGVDYFFINSDFVADKLGNWALNLRNVTLEFDIHGLHFKFYPVYQAIYLGVYYVMSLGVWFLYELGYNAISGWQDIGQRNKKIKVDKLALEVKLAGRSIEEPMNMENENKLILHDFTKRYGKSNVYAVKDANLVVSGGEIYGFLGPNGAGKSTIIKSIVGIQTITDGAIEVCGYDVATQSVQAKRQIGFVPDHYALYERLTAREYINYIADLYEVSKEDRDERMDRMIKRFELESAIDNPIRTYSHGMKQKVTIMAALIHNPKVWILDEPLTGLDPNSIFQVKECMKEHAAAGNIVFFSSHIIDVVERICDKIAIIRKGQIQCVRDVHEMERNGESLEKFYMDIVNTVVEPIRVDEGKKEEQSNENKRRKA
ncbi:MAG: YwaF family protein [Clostridiales bacterium]|nr:YwaF family protein [Clostridiales bacterium]